MVLNFALAGRSRIEASFQTLLQKPGYALGLVIGVVLAGAASSYAGMIHAYAGWHRMRDRLADDGFVALGEVLAPAGAIEDYKDGIWKGIWRVHGASLGFIILQAPIFALLLIPQRVAEQLFSPVAEAYAGHPQMARMVGVGVPTFFLVCAVVILAAQQLTAFRMLGDIKGPHKLGTLFVVTGASWRRTLEDTQTILSLSILAGLGAAVGMVFGAVNEWLGDAANLYRPTTLAEWVQLAVLVVFGALFLEAVGRLSVERSERVAEPASPYSFTDWLVSWIGDVYEWLTAKGMKMIGVGATFLVLVGTAFSASNFPQALEEFFDDGPFAFIEALNGAGAFNEHSWGALGWFIAAALLLLHLRKEGGES